MKKVLTLVFGYLLLSSEFAYGQVNDLLAMYIRSLVDKVGTELDNERPTATESDPADWKLSRLQLQVTGGTSWSLPFAVKASASANVGMYWRKKVPPAGN